MAEKLQPKNALQKPAVKQIINLEDISLQKTNYDHDSFVSDLAYHCGNFLSWIANKNSHQYAESMWKNDMRKKASQLYPELDVDELRRLVDRDWRIMNEQNRNNIIIKYSEAKKEEQIVEKLKNLRQNISELKENSK